MVPFVPRPPDNAPGIPDLRGRTVLIAEDAKGDRSLLAALLEPTGARIVSAANGLEALAACQRDRPDLMLLDIDLPGLNGAGVARRLRAGGEALPIIALTGYARGEDAAIAFAAGANAYLTKPFRIDSLYGLLLRHLGASAAE